MGESVGALDRTPIWSLPGPSRLAGASPKAFPLCRLLRYLVSVNAPRLYRASGRPRGSAL